MLDLSNNAPTWSTSSQVSPKSPRTGSTRANCGKPLVESGRTRYEFGWKRPKSGLLRSSSPSQTWPITNSVEVAPDLVNSGPIGANIRHTLADPAPNWLKAVNTLTLPTKTGPESTKFERSRPNFAPLQRHAVLECNACWEFALAIFRKCYKPS